MNIKVDIQNIFSDKIGKKNGITEPEFNKYLKKIQDALKNLNKKKKELGFLNLPYIKKPLDKLTIKTKNYQNILVLGIGGSILGGIALNRALTNLYGNYNLKNKKFFFIDNIDPDQISDLKKSLDFKKTLFIIISKSGKTPETVAVFLHLLKFIPKPLNKNLIIVTEQNNNFLYNFGLNEDIQIYQIPKNIGGRFSILTPVGLLPAYITGINIKKILRGAREANINLNQKSLNENNSAKLALACYLHDKLKSHHIIVLMPYSAKLGRVADWYIQLLAESIGKNEKVGLTPIKAVGVTDQHSQLQLFMEGPNDKLIIFIEIEKFKNKIKIPKLKNGNYKDIDFLYKKTLNQLITAEKRATEMALAKAGRPNITIKLPYLSEETFGELIFTLETQIALLGELYGIDAFDQPGVELSKILTRKYLK